MPASIDQATRDQALRLYQEVGATEAARRLNISSRSIIRWANDAGLLAPDNIEKGREAAAKGMAKVQQTWADFRQAEALQAGALANAMRNRLRREVEEGVAGRDIQALTTAYAILVDKAELLSNNATQRIEVWAQSELDVEMRQLIDQMENTIRERRP